MFSFMQRKTPRHIPQSRATNTEVGAPVTGWRPECPLDLTEQYQAVSSTWTQRVRASTAIEYAQYDQRLGALHLTLPGRNTLTLAVSDHVNAEHIHCMARLEPCRVHQCQDGPHLTVIVYSASWTYSITGLPALACS